MKTIDTPRLSRRRVLRGLGGVALALPFLEGLVPRAARAQSAPNDAFAIFFRQANGVAQQSGSEPERFFPRTLGALTPESMADRATGELEAYASKLLVLRNVNYGSYNWGDGHAAGALHALTARPPVVDGAGGSAEAAGESIDHRIGRELNDGGRDSLFMYAGRGGGWLNGPCISYRGSGVRRSALHNPLTAYQTLVGAAGGLSPEAADRIIRRGQSVNDLVRGQLSRVLASPALSAADRQRLELHQQSVRDVEVRVGCRMNEDEERILAEQAPGFDSTDGDETLQTARLHMDIAAIAVACGFTRSVAIQVGVGNDGFTRYRNLETGALMENFHFLSHRRLSHGGDGEVIANADLQHHYVDVHFARTFRHLLDKLSEWPMPDGGTLLDRGVSIWYNDNASGPPHAVRNVPWILAGGAGGFLRTGQYLELTPGNTTPNHGRLLNTIGSAVGLRKSDGAFIDNFGDPSLNRSVLDEMRA
jgi:hypothetical protein